MEKTILNLFDTHKNEFIAWQPKDQVIKHLIINI
jgi:hypothetical protein